MALEFCDLKKAENAIFGAIFAIFRVSLRLMSTYCRIFLSKTRDPLQKSLTSNTSSPPRLKATRSHATRMDDHLDPPVRRGRVLVVHCLRREITFPKAQEQENLPADRAS
jgi:hypothetical protein